MFSDGLVERRGEAIDDGIDRLARTRPARGHPATLIWESTRTDDSDDDITIITLQRR